MDFHVCPMEAWNICAAGVKLYQLQPLCQVAGFHRVAYVELLKDVLSVSVYRVNADVQALDRKSTRLNSSHANISYAVFCLKKKKITSLMSTYFTSIFC